jgi:hypothetical protein
MRTRLKQTVITATAATAAAAAAAAAAADDDDEDKKNRLRDSSNRNTKEYFRLVTGIAFPSSMHMRVTCMIG